MTFKTSLTYSAVWSVNAKINLKSNYLRSSYILLIITLNKPNLNSNKGVSIDAHLLIQ